MAYHDKVVYTCLIGNYDDVPCHNYVSDDWDYILFTDNDELIKKGNIYHWTVRKNPFNELDGTRNSRYAKINPHLVLSEYKYSFYLDANIIINDKRVFDNLYKFIENDTKIANPLHPVRNCIYDEAKAVIEYFVEYSEIVKKQIAFLRSENYPKNNGLFENGLMFRQHNDPNIIKAQDLWWQMLLDYSKRDQLSGVYSFWKYGVVITPLYAVRGYHRNCEEISLVVSQNHKSGIQTKQIIPMWLIKLVTMFVPIKKHRKSLRQKLIYLSAIKK